MKLTLTLTDERRVSHFADDKRTEPYERATVTDFTANAAVLAGLLRAIADDINPNGEHA